MSIIALIDYGSGNLRSAAKALERAAADSGIAAEIAVTADPEVVLRADRVVLPGVGAFGDCRRGLAAVPGMIAALEETVLRRGRPFLGICIGMQLMARTGLEHGRHEGLGWLDAEVVPLTPADPALKIPHMGWNELRLARPDHPVLAGLEHGTHAYFVHSYHMVPADPAQVLATCDYGGPVAAVVGRDTLVGTQFHPEKSQAAGLRLIANFLSWRP
ncbi:imidazole glycerol phosphate synthase subunit HisH [Rhodospirillum centenum]|uniref:Imidazole glycerol phosphate synthase subunit HisH n=1 Tax=Rhodospirillum centenum (strain ATCC 51521 / SW) TaxID=414684 RepID=B6IWI4_RHOCS|nr:imidazole glycerol phosphate synthase subunit HisH [Rhodospirillum centenum]ACJ00658.1 imidazole glycerol phosphate synthase, glutamine amidotransferase subunit [Rhodospirillum centenum SW]